MTTTQKLRELGIPPNSTKSLSLSQSNVMLGTGTPVYNQADVQANVNAYATSDDVYSIVRRIAKTAATVKRKAYKVVDEKALKELKQFKSTQNKYGSRELLKEAVLIRKALEELPDDHDLQKFLDNPNPEYAASVFYEGVYTSRLLTGNSFIYTPSLEFGVNKGKPAEMWLLPPQYMSLRVTDTFPRKILKFVLQITSMVTIDKEEVMHLKYYNPKFDYMGNELLGMSPLTAGSRIITRQEAETDYSVNAFQNSGISGIVANKTMQSDEVEEGALGKMKDNFYRESSGTQNARKLLFQVGDIAYIPIGLSPVDMNVLESEKRTFKKLCNLYGLSDMLFNNDGIGNGVGGKTDVVFKDLYTNAVLPECYSLDDAINMTIVPKFATKERYHVMSDITEITELQDDMKDMAAIFASLPVMIPNVIAKAYAWPESTDPDMDEVYIKTGYTKLQDLGAVPDIPLSNATGN